MYEAHIEDLKGKYQRIGFSGLYKTIARTIVYITVPIICLLSFATAMANANTASAEYGRVHGFQAVLHTKVK
jgi:hypothetical protein